MIVSQQVDWLFERFERNYPKAAREWRDFVGDGPLLRAVGLLAVLYGKQNGVIHANCYLRNTLMTLADREWCWINEGRASEFFSLERREQPALFEELDASRDAILFAWNSFELLLLFTQHAEYVALCTGHLPSERELLNGDWQLWNERLRRRFEPLFEEVCCV